MSTAALEVYNSSGALLINTNEPCLKLIANGTGTTTLSAGMLNPVSIPYNGWPECPTVLIRMGTATQIGAFSITAGAGTVQFNVYGNGSFDWAICVSAKSAGGTQTGTFGLETFDASGNTTFSTSHIIPRIFHIAQIPTVYNGNAASVTGSIGGIPSQGVKPWAIMRDVGWALTGEFGESAAFAMSMSADFSSISIFNIIDGISPSINPYAGGRAMMIPLALIPGL